MSKPSPSSQRLHSPAKGTEVTQKQLIELRFAAASLLRHDRTRKVASTLGGHRSRLRGRGLEFQEVRQYQAGDEIRHIDWRVTARTSVAHTKLFQAERERPVILCLDQSRSMFFGSRCCMKSVVAAMAAGALAWAALERSDRVGGLVFNDSEHTEVRPRNSRRAVLHLLNTMTGYNRALSAATAAEQSGQLARSLEELRRTTRPGSTVYIISDFYDFDEAARRQLHNISRHNDVIGVVISDPMEAAFRWHGDFSVSDGENVRHLSANTQLRQWFNEHISGRFEALTAEFRQLGVTPLQLHTNDDWLEVLRAGLRH